MVLQPIRMEHLILFFTSKARQRADGFGPWASLRNLPANGQAEDAGAPPSLENLRAFIHCGAGGHDIINHHHSLPRDFRPPPQCKGTPDVLQPGATIQCGLRTRMAAADQEPLHGYIAKGAGQLLAE